MSQPSPRQVRVVNEVLEAFHAILYFSGHVQQRWADHGMAPRTEGYVAGRAAPMGAVGPGTAAAVFFNFNPAVFRAALPAAWAKAAPTVVLAERAAGLQETFEEVDAPTAGLDEIVSLATTAMRAVPLAGRPLAAANGDVPLPDEPFARAWQAVAVLREHRGDGHVAALTAQGIGPVQALVLMAAWQDSLSRRFLQGSRSWADEDWEAAVEALRARGLLATHGGLSDAGRRLRNGVEDATDRLATPPYATLGLEGTRRLVGLVRPLALALAEGGAYPRAPDVPAGLPDS